MHDHNTSEDLQQKVERIFGLLPEQGTLMVRGVALSSDMSVSGLRDATVDLLVKPPVIKMKIGVLAHVVEGSQLNTAGGTLLTGGEVVKVDAINGEFACVAVWNPKYNQATCDDLRAVDDEFDGFSDTASHVPLSCLVPARRPRARPVQVRSGY